MEDYKQHLINYMCPGCKSVKEFYDYIRDNTRDGIEYNSNENGFHSRYMGTYYEPALILTGKNCNVKALYWLFDGDIRDCDHPCYILVKNDRISLVIYYSFERLTTFQPTVMSFANEQTINFYNRCVDAENRCIIKLLDGYDNPDGERIINDTTLLCTPEFYPLCDQMREDIVHFKFAD